MVVAVTPDGSAVYVTNQGDGTVSVIATATNTVSTTIPVGSGASSGPFGVAVAPNGTVYVANLFDGTVSVITANAVVATIPVGSLPAAFGQFIQPLIPAGQPEPGTTSCNGKSVAALSNQFGDLTTAAATLGFANVKALKESISSFCTPASPVASAQ